MDISVHIKPNSVAGLREGRCVDGGDTQELLKVAQELGVQLRPVFPVASTPEQANQYFVQIDEPSSVKKVLEKLNDCKAVETAYHVPRAELP
jgi:hypothetical protein